MAHDQHPHHHHHIDPEAGDARVAGAIAVNLFLTLAQIVGGVISGSMALIADAIHNLSDALSLVIAFGARKIARKPRDGGMTFGYGRAEVVAAMVNYTTLIVISVYLFAEGVSRLFNPPEIAGWTVVIIAVIALSVDLVTALLTYTLSKDSLNIRAAFLHNLADAGTSVAVIFGGVVILLWDWRLIDPLLTIAISLYILWQALRELRPVIRILMLGAPEGTKAGDIAAALEGIEGVENVHHIHLWQIDEHRNSVEAHVVISGEAAPVLVEVKALLRDRFAIAHSTLEVEAPGAGCAGDADPAVPAG
ncbi:cation diffusion facilitator family transporter [Celeribacter halophilus]|uniref:Cobalt-zinc-cadmium efflux system protein n=1 Tax=Celeribacter halophilus TaxID=576117 RepID=A0A1I3V2M5_9RHOB|nr:cation diffusion facilitator family transporter [Celeribacter halophilus]PZX09747.1 cobalt-zinc-cadmium efflux system protein [Celeribacter halophilus]SFJ89362.1 cobalt-zinc-cadmium efflux system protein [Celeribacter halophilus]